MLRTINKWLFLPSGKALLINAVLFFAVFIFVVYFGFFMENLGGFTSPLAKTDHSLWLTVCFLLISSGAAATLIYGKTLKFFLCSTECLKAAVGTTVAVVLIYAARWSVVQIARNKQIVVTLEPSAWSLQDTLNNLKYGSMLFLYSSISFAGSLAISGQADYDFTPLVNDWRNWKVPVNLLRNKTRLDEHQHKALVALTDSMLARLVTIGGYAQPNSKAAAESLREPMERFKAWYEAKTAVTFKDCRELDEEIRADAERIRRLC